MLARLEEFETMMLLLHEENLNTCGLNGSLMAVVETKTELQNLFERIDALEKLVDDVKRTVFYYEAKVEAAEKELGIMQAGLKIKELLKPLLVCFVRNYLNVCGHYILLLQMLNSDSGTLTRNKDNEGAAVIFKTEDYFPESIGDLDL